MLRAAREAGVAFLEVARYNDVLGTAPLPTGYSEVVFGEVFRASQWPRDEVVVAEKLWWEFWPAQSASRGSWMRRWSGRGSSGSTSSIRIRRRRSSSSSASSPRSPI